MRGFVVHDYKRLDVWNKSVALTAELYSLTSRFPDTEPRTPYPDSRTPFLEVRE
jgi:hypothetical protein